MTCALTELDIGPSDEIVAFGRSDWWFSGQQFYGRVMRFHADGTLDWWRGPSSGGFSTLC